MLKDELYASKINRDLRCRELKKDPRALRVSRSIVRNQQLHPMYIEDQKNTSAGRDSGFGNSAYQSFWGVLYRVEWEQSEVPKQLML